MTLIIDAATRPAWAVDKEEHLFTTGMDIYIENRSDNLCVSVGVGSLEMLELSIQMQSKPRGRTAARPRRYAPGHLGVISARVDLATDTLWIWRDTRRVYRLGISRWTVQWYMFYRYVHTATMDNRPDLLVHRWGQMKPLKQWSTKGGNLCYVLDDCEFMSIRVRDRKIARLWRSECT